MKIQIDLFEYPTKEEMLTLLKESPLYNFSIEESVLYREDLHPIKRLDYDISVQEILSLFHNRLFQVNLSYAYVMYYFNRGIPDEEWAKPIPTGGVEYFPHFQEEHWTNKVHFEHHIDTFFQKAFTVLDIFGHLLFKYFDLKQEENRKGRLQDITFNNAFWNLKNQKKDINLHKKLGGIKFSDSYKEASRIRNEIIHNQPPYSIHNRRETHRGVVFTKVYYIPSDKLKETMYNLSESIKEIVGIFSQHVIEKR
ncbi:Cthe_2314 family HEPN domain-containing protein [Bacillus thuringiensis]|uniref:Cthe_2314 family HEPN domain-containing protein n=1 Tax=Bacillus thuringiensis TaxID=1428 RepID=UPI001F0B359A|nr:Cthe_2314 family HEPN domain-containing protein [Bacillus thuringiensis]